ncbi:hypothetical protein [Belnapia sp. F-4-1]|uniref:hypothetical protein n=1 Tax=Belnapia sp. F-4-1 TaxID=1545443 RepID=UPI001364A0B8|nr:hypothetical protein [Belnapia sp. F-4-1]
MAKSHVTIEHWALSLTRRGPSTWNKPRTMDLRFEIWQRMHEIAQALACIDDRQMQ